MYSTILLLLVFYSFYLMLFFPADLEQQIKESMMIQESMNVAVEDEALKKLKDELQVIRSSLFQSDDNLDAKYGLVKEFITRYIKRSLDSTTPIEDQLKKLCFEEFLIPTKLHQWCLFEVKKLRDELQAQFTTKHESPPTSIEVVTPLFCKETMFHALLLIKVAQKCTAKSYESFLLHEFHDFDEVSLSLENSGRSIERYAIAKRGKVLYIAFCGEHKISSWQDKYSTINEGKLSLSI